MFKGHLTQENSFHELLFLTNIGRDVSRHIARDAFLSAITEQNAERRTYAMGMILNGLMAKGPTDDEIAGLLDATFSMDEFKPHERKKFSSPHKTITVAGSGKKGFKTVNISSMACIVASCYGNITILKLCSPSASSTTGSQDLFTSIGGNIDVDPLTLDKQTRLLGVGFYPVEHVLPRFASVYSGHYYAPHALSFALAAMTCHYKTDYLLYGLSHPNLTLSLDLFRRYDYPHALVVSSTFDGIHYIDEMLDQSGVGVQGYRNLEELNPRRSSINLSDELGLIYSESVRDAISQDNDKESNVIKGLSGLYAGSTLSSQIAINAALILFTAEMDGSFKNLFEVCLKIIESGEPIKKLRNLVKTSGGDEQLLDQYLIKAKLS